MNRNETKTWAVLLLLLTQANSFADLYQESAMSLEWIADSADALFVVRVDAIDEATKRAVKVTEIARIEKPMSGNKRFSLPKPSTWKHKLLGLEAGHEWLVAVRGTGQSARVFRGVNLTSPSQSFRSAAIVIEDNKAKVLLTKEELLTAVKRRIEVGHHLPAHCDRELVDLCASRMQDDKLPLAAYIGGFPSQIDCRYWDEEVPLDTHLNVLVVPASFPRPKLPRDSERIPDEDGGFKVSRRERMLMGSYPKLSPIASKLVGNWELNLDDVVVRLTLHPESAMLAEVRAKPNVNLEPLSFFGNIDPGLAGGMWALEEQNLRVTMDAILHRGRWSSRGSAALFRGTISKLTDSTVSFADDTKMVRTSEPVRTFRYPQSEL